MKKSLFIALALVMIANLSNAQTIYRCNNDPNVTLSPNMFRTLQAAHDAAIAGDIIYIEPSVLALNGSGYLSYGDLTCTKTLKIIGNGYEHSNNTSITQPFFNGSSLVGTLTIKSTATATELKGLTNAVNSYSNIEAQNVKVTGCQGFQFFLKRAATGENASGSQFLKNRSCSFRFSAYSTNPVNPACAYTPNQIENLVFKNNRNTNLDWQNSAGIWSGCIVGSSILVVPAIKNVTISNESNTSNFYVFGENVTLHSSILFTPINLVSNSSIGVSSLTASNNVCIAACGYGNNNVENVTASTLFIVASPSKDEDFRLSPTSPAIGIGLGGIDAGLYGGSDPYRISGLAPIPQITSYSKNASSGVYTITTPMTVTISVRGNN